MIAAVSFAALGDVGSESCRACGCVTGVACRLQAEVQLVAREQATVGKLQLRAELFDAASGEPAAAPQTVGLGHGTALLGTS